MIQDLIKPSEIIVPASDPLIPEAKKILMKYFHDKEKKDKAMIALGIVLGSIKERSAVNNEIQTRIALSNLQLKEQEIDRRNRIADEMRKINKKADA